MNQDQIQTLNQRANGHDFQLGMLEHNVIRQKQTNEDVHDALRELDHEICILRKLAAGFAFAAGGLFVLVLKTKTDIREIRKAMNEG